MNYTVNGITIANNIKAERNRANKTQDDIAKEVGISRKTYIKYETDASKISAILLFYISNAIGCELSCFYLNTTSTKCE